MKVTINGRTVEVAEGATVLEAARAAGFGIPTLCYLKDLNEVAACRICVVEVKGADRLVAACNTKATDGMEVETASARVLSARKHNLELVLSAHDCNCLTCVKNGNCNLQTLARDMGVLERQPYPTKVAKDRWNRALPLVRSDSKCISCLRCVNVCDRIQGLKVWDLLNVGSRAKVAVREGLDFADAGCTLCGQCVVHCPVSALAVRDDTAKFLMAVNDPAKTVALQVAPRAKAVWGEVFRRIGVDFVFDSCSATDLVARERRRELQERQKEGVRLPVLSSSCPAWVRFLRSEHPELLPHLSSVRSPQQMFAVETKAHFAKEIGKRPEDLFCVAVAPCPAKKREADQEGGVDLVLTPREVCQILKRQGVDAAELSEADFDPPAVTGDGSRVRIVNGLGNARRFVADLKAGRAQCDCAEVMACPGGCAWCGHGEGQLR